VKQDELYVNDLPDFINLVTQLKLEWFPREPNWAPWFRGQSHADWKLVPKLYRPSSFTRSIRIIEDEIRQEFIIRAPSLTSDKPQNTWEWYFMMQHSGAPTRLLDWTEGALLALYFAVRDNNRASSASVWVIDPWWLNKRVTGEREVVAPGATVGMSTTDAARYEPWLPDRYDSTAKLPELPVAVYPTHTARRISTQRSCFTVHGSEESGLERLAVENSSRLVKIVIPVNQVQIIAEQLTLCGIDEVTIFPDPDGLGRSLSRMLLAEAK
jgi:hypothetical protein